MGVHYSTGGKAIKRFSQLSTDGQRGKGMLQGGKGKRRSVWELLLSEIVISFTKIALVQIVCGT